MSTLIKVLCFSQSKHLSDRSYFVVKLSNLKLDKNIRHFTYSPRYALLLRETKNLCIIKLSELKDIKLQRKYKQYRYKVVQI